MTTNQQWQPIETAPKDGKTVRLYEKGGAVHIGKWGKLKNWYVWDWLIPNHEQGTWNKITHWQPL